MRKTILPAALLAAAALYAALAGGSAQAQSSSHYAFCLLTDDAQECTYNSMAQCLASKRGNADFCEPNNTYTGASRGY